MKQKPTNIPRHDLDELMGLYALVPVEVTPIYLGMDNINISVSTDDGARYILKICAAPADTVHAQLRVMHQCGSPDQQPVMTTSGSPTFTYGGRVGYLLPYVEGDDLLDQELGADDIREIARFHRATASRIARIVERPAPNIWDLSHFCANLQLYERFIPAGWATQVPDLTGTARATVHNDFTRSNLLRLANGQLHLLDYGDVSHGREITDLAVALAHFCVEGTPRDDIVPHVELFLSATEARPDLRLLYRLIKLRFVQAVALTRLEEDQFGAHPRGPYWLNLGEAGVDALGQIPEQDFVARLARSLADKSQS